jgi:hypothetical protein
MLQSLPLSHLKVDVLTLTLGKSARENYSASVTKQDAITLPKAAN